MKLLLIAIAFTVTVYGTQTVNMEPLRKYKGLKTNTIDVWCMEGTKWLWSGRGDTPPVQVMESVSDRYKAVPKPSKCKYTK